MFDVRRRWKQHVALAAVLAAVASTSVNAQSATPGGGQAYEHQDTRRLVSLVSDAAELVRNRGEAVFADLRLAGSRWNQGETYVFVLDPEGNMLVHPDPALQGKNQLALKDVNGRPIIRGLIDATTESPARPEGWYHYEWPVPGELLPRWKSTYVRLVSAPSGKRYLVGSGMYNDRMERAFVVDMVSRAVAQVEQKGTAALPMLHDLAGPFRAKDTYVFVIAPDGTDLANPGFRNLEGRNSLDLKDTQGRFLIREMLDVVRDHGAGWVDYMWPKPGENVSTQKSTYVKRARLGDSWVMVGSGVYLADAPSSVTSVRKMSAPELMALVREGAELLKQRGENAYSTFRTPGSKWLHDDTYFFVWTMSGKRVFHGANPESEGLDVSGITEAIGLPYGRMFLDAASSPSGEGWVHYMQPEPADIFPIWKSAFVKSVTFPSGDRYLVGCGIYNMQMDREFITDLVNRAADLVAAGGPAAFPALRDKTGPFVFMDTYVFVDSTEGVELVNPAQPSLERMNLMSAKDVKGKAVVKEYITEALKHGSAWVDYYWYRPGTNTPARKEAYVRLIRHGGVTYVVGSGLYVDSRKYD